MIPNEAISVKERVFLGFILLLGLGLRLYAAYAVDGFHYFAINDEVIDYKYVMAFLSGDPFAEYIGQPEFAGAQVPGPLWTLFSVLLYKLGGSSFSVGVLYSAAINSIVVYLVYRLSRNFVDKKYSLYTALLFATLPWPIYHAAGFYNPNVLALLGSLLFIAMWRVCVEEDSRHIFIVCLILFAIPQFHMIGLFYIPVATVVIFILSPRINKRWMLAGIIVGAGLYLPYLIGDMQHGWANTKKMFSEETIHSWGALKALIEPASLLAVIPGSATPDDVNTFKELGDRYFGSYFILLAISVVSLLTALAIYLGYLKYFTNSVVVLIKKRRNAIEVNKKTLFVGGMIFLPLTLFLFTGHSYASRYAMLIMPLLFLLPALMVSKASSLEMKKLFPVVTVMVAIYSSYLAVVTYHYNAELLQNSAYVMPSFKKLERISDIVNNDAGASKVRLRMSSGIQQLVNKGHYSKIYSVYPEYIAVDQQYKFAKKVTAGAQEYVLYLPQEALPQGSRIIYHDNNVVITAADQVYASNIGSNNSNTTIR